jgi:iron-sulfur cluster assembly enzyme ISCU, mitochondrial
MSTTMRANASCGRSAAVPSRAYHERVIDHYENPRNVGSMDKSSNDVGTGLVSERVRAGRKRERGF